MGRRLQVAVSNARRAKFLLLRSLVPPARVRYSPKTFQAECLVIADAGDGAATSSKV